MKFLGLDVSASGHLRAPFQLNSSQTIIQLHPVQLNPSQQFSDSEMFVWSVGCSLCAGLHLPHGSWLPIHKVFSLTPNLAICF